MLKKILSILCITSIAWLSNCMAEDYSMLIPSFWPKDVTITDEELGKEFHRLIITEGQELQALKWMGQHNAFIDENLYPIIELAGQFKRKQVIGHVLENYILGDRDMILCHLYLGNIDRVKELTQFEKYRFNEDGLDIISFQEDLPNLGLGSGVLDAIVSSDAINYQDLFGNRYLQIRIRENNLNAVLKFIHNASPKELDAKEYNTLSTALHEAAFGWERCQKQNDIIGERSYADILQSLLGHGADPRAYNSNMIQPSKLKFFFDNPELLKKWRRVYLDQTLESRASKLGRSVDRNIKKTRLKKSKRSNLKFAATLAGLSLAGAAIFYLGYKIFCKRSVNTSLRLK